MFISSLRTILIKLIQPISIQHYMVYDPFQMQKVQRQEHQRNIRVIPFLPFHYDILYHLQCFQLLTLNIKQVEQKQNSWRNYPSMLRLVILTIIFQFVFLRSNFTIRKRQQWLQVIRNKHICLINLNQLLSK